MSNLIRGFVWAGILIPFRCSLPAPQSNSDTPAHILLVVNDQSGAVVPGAEVQIPSLRKTLTTDAYGSVSFEISSGDHDVRIKKPGFLSTTKHIEVRNGTTETVNVVLNIGSPCPCLTVTSMPSNLFPKSEDVSPTLAVPFPNQSEDVSPDGRYVILNEKGHRRSHYTVLLADRARKTRRKLFNYGGQIVVLWNSDGRLFAVTDYGGNHGSRCSVLSTERNAPSIRVVDVLLAQLHENERRVLEDRLRTDHCGLEAATWIGPTRLEVELSGCRGTQSTRAQFYSVNLPLDEPGK